MRWNTAGPSQISFHYLTTTPIIGALFVVIGGWDAVDGWTKARRRQQADAVA